MTATEELRRLLDERGMEWSDGTLEGGVPNNHRTFWGEGGRYRADECFSEVALCVEFHATPEQAIEATLGPSDPREHGLVPHFWTGDETLHIDLGKLPERIDVTLPDPRGREVYSARVHRFDPERGECHAIISDNLTESEGTGDAWADCSECGHLLYVLTDPSSEPPNYCPHCGRKVMRPCIRMSSQ